MRSIRLKVVSVALLILTLACPRESASKGAPITWAPVTVAKTLGDGRELVRSEEVQFTTAVQLNAVQVRVSPNLREFVRISPEHFDRVNPGQPYTVQVDYWLPRESAEGVYKGSLHLISRKRTVPNVLEIEISVSRAGNSLRDETRILSTESLSLLASGSVADGTFVFESENAELRSLKVGDVVLFYPTESLPSGALQRVVAKVQSSDGSTTLSCVQASLSDAFERLSINVQTALEPELTGIAASARHRVSGAEPTTGPAIRLVLEDYELDQQVSVDGIVEVRPGIDMALEIDGSQLQYFRLALDLAQSVDLTFLFGGELEVDKRAIVARYPLGVLWVYAAVPIPFVLTLEMVVGVEGETSGGVTVSINQSFDSKVGFLFESGEWQPIKEVNAQLRALPPTVTVEAELEPYVGPQIAMRAFGAVGPEVFAQGYAALDANPTRCPDWWRFFLGARLGGELETTFLYPGDFSYELDLLDWKNLVAAAESCPDSACPREVGLYSMQGAQDVDASGGLAFVAQRFPTSALHVVSLSEPSAPTRVGYLVLPDYPQGITVVGHRAYVPLCEAGLSVVDISQPSSPIVLGSSPADECSYSASVSGSYAFVSEVLSGFQVVDISNPSLPRRVAGRDSPDLAYGLDLDEEGHLFLADSEGGLRVFSVANQLQPVEIGSVATPGQAFDVRVRDGLAYVADYRQNGMAIIDVGIPAAPSILSLFDTPGLAEGIDLYFNYALIADSTSLVVVDVSDSQNPRAVASVGEFTGGADSVKVVGNYALVADSAAGLRIFDLACLLNR